MLLYNLNLHAIFAWPLESPYSILPYGFAYIIREIIENNYRDNLIGRHRDSARCTRNSTMAPSFTPI